MHVRATSTIALDSLLDRLGLEGGLREQVRIAFGHKYQSEVPGSVVRRCLEWVVDVQANQEPVGLFVDYLATILNDGSRAELERIAAAMLSGHPEPDRE